MVNRIRQLLGLPVLEEEEKTRIAKLFHVILSIFLAISGGMIAITLALSVPSPTPSQMGTLLAEGAMVVAGVILLFVARRGYIRPASVLLLFLLWLVITGWTVTVAGISSDSSSLIYALIIALAGLLLSGRGAMAFTAASLLAIAAGYYAESSGWLVINRHSFGPADLAFTAAPLILIGLLLRYAVNSLIQALERAHANERAQEEANRELEVIRATLEQRVADRTADLERRSAQLQAAAEVSRTATATLDPELLIWQVSELIQQRFNLYHVGLFQMDETGRWAEYRAGAGEAGRLLAQEGFRLEVGGPSMVGWCTQNAQTRVAQDVSQEPVRFQHPLTPATRSEVALPLIARGQVIGALVVQSDRPGAFDESTVAILETMADQVAIALDNARLYSQAQEALEATRRAYGELSRQAWSELLRGRVDWGYVYTRQKVSPVEGDWRPEMRRALQTGQVVRGDGAQGPALAIPLRVRDQVIGVLGFYKEPAGGPDRWTAEETALLETLVAQLGVALESAQLFEETQRRAVREQITGQITARIRETLDVETMLRTAVQEVRQALGLPEVVIRLTPQALAGAGPSGPPGQNPRGEGG